MDKTFIDNNARQKKVNTDYHNLRHNLRAKKTFFKKIHPRGKSCKYYTSRVLYNYTRGKNAFPIFSSQKPHAFPIKLHVFSHAFPILGLNIN